MTKTNAGVTVSQLPPVELLNEQENVAASLPESEVERNKKLLCNVFNSVGIGVKSVKVFPGPSVSLYELTLMRRKDFSKVRNLEEALRTGVGVKGFRLIAGKDTVGVELANEHPCLVHLGNMIKGTDFQKTAMTLPVVMGRTATDEPLMYDLAEMSHLLVGGATGQGKTTLLNNLIISLLYKKCPEELKFVLIDPKGVEFDVYKDLGDAFLAKLPHNGNALVTDVDASVSILRSLRAEMDRRYDLFKKVKVHNIKEYNEKFVNHMLSNEEGHRLMPYIVAIIDEFAELVMACGRDVELSIVRIAQQARAVGIHIIIATQRPTLNIITGNIKANFSVRVAFRVSSIIDSRAILDRPGAESLVGRGDMLFSTPDETVRAQCAWADMAEVDRVVRYIHEHAGSDSTFTLPEETEVH